MNLQEAEYENMHSSDSGLGPVPSSSEHSHEPLGSGKVKEFLPAQLFKDDSAAWSLIIQGKSK
jgi:hypothetical protein